MKRKVATLDDLMPDGIRVVVDWSKFQVGATFFLPCVRQTTARSQVNVIAARNEWKVRMQSVVEGGLSGIRVWRVQ